MGFLDQCNGRSLTHRSILTSDSLTSGPDIHSNINCLHTNKYSNIYFVMFFNTVWLVRLGPTKCGDELYSYFISTVATASGRSYVVYARDVKELKTEYDNVVKKWLKAKDYSDPVPAEQPEECVYEEDAKK